jgi:ABC-type Fe3+ transport system substrate-binding protein
MTTKSDYTDEEWAALRRAPLVAGMAISLADPGGPIELTKETMASIKAMSNPGSDAELLVAVSQDAMAMAQEHHNPIGDFKPKGTTAGQEILDEVRRVNAILTAKATPEEAEAFRAWMMTAAQAAADAAKEGGFMGFHAVRVSEGEKKMLEQLRAAFGVQETDPTGAS